MKLDVRQFLIDASSTLKNSRNFGDDYCRFKSEFFRLYQRNLIFSTRFGAELFDELSAMLDSGKLIDKPGEYDKNINEWVKTEMRNI